VDIYRVVFDPTTARALLRVRVFYFYHCRVTETFDEWIFEEASDAEDGCLIQDPASTSTLCLTPRNIGERNDA